MNKCFPSLKGCRKGASFHVPPKRGISANRRRFPALLSISFGVLSKAALPQGSSHRDAPFLEPSLIHLSKSRYRSPKIRYELVMYFRDKVCVMSQSHF